MNAKKIKLHDYHHCYGSPMCDPQLFPRAAAATTAGLSLHPGPGLVGSLPQRHGGGGGGWVHEEHTATTPRAAQGQGGCVVGSDAAAFFAAEELMMGTARFDSPLGGTTTALQELTAFAKGPPFGRPRPTTGGERERERLYPVDPLPLRDCAAVRTYYVRPQQRDGATEAPPSLELPFQRRRQQQVHGLFGDPSTGRLLGGGEPEAHSFPAHVSEFVTNRVAVLLTKHAMP
jgi:hypothetical protein